MSQEVAGTPTCHNCGAPEDGELVHCKFCKAPISEEAARTAIPCPQCKTACRWGKQKCAVCQAWLVVSCVFCGALSPHNVSNCLSCNEAFAGAPQRKAAMQQQQQHQQQMQDVGTWGTVAAAFVGAAAGSAITSDWSGSSTVDTYDDSNADEDDDS